MSNLNKKDVIMALLDSKIQKCEFKQVMCEFYDKRLGCILATLGSKDCIKKEGEKVGDAKQGKLL